MPGQPSKRFNSHNLTLDKKVELSICYSVSILRPRIPRITNDLIWMNFCVDLLITNSHINNSLVAMVRQKVKVKLFFLNIKEVIHMNHFQFYNKISRSHANKNPSNND